MLPSYDAERAGSWLEGALTRFEADNEGLVAPTRELLARTIADAPRHARLLNTLSMLEHMGSHKIMSTQHTPGIDQPTLRHVAEEAHHAYFMKRQAEKTAARPLEYAAVDLLAPAAARLYFQRLEAALIRALAGASPRAVYLYMSMIVEFRALWFYGLYQHALARAQHALSLKRVLGEEQNHLSEMAGRLETDGELSDARVREFLDHEKRLYGRLLAAIQRAVA
jgi:hypothetical protein